DVCSSDLARRIRPGDAHCLKNLPLSRRSKMMPLRTGCFMSAIPRRELDACVVGVVFVMSVLIKRRFPPQIETGLPNLPYHLHGAMSGYVAISVDIYRRPVVISAEESNIVITPHG